MSSRKAINFVVNVAGYPSGVLRVLEVHQSMGGRKLDHAVLTYDLGAPGFKQYVQNLDLAQLQFPSPNGPQSLSGKEVVITATAPGKPQGKVVHWGKITNMEIDVGKDEGIQIVSRMERTHFGLPLGFQFVWNPLISQVVEVDHDVVFNPEVDGVGIIGNKRVGTENIPVSTPLFIDPGSTESAASNTLQRTTQSTPDQADRIAELAFTNWNLVDAVEFICWSCNRPQKYVTNPTRSELLRVLNADLGILKNHRLRPDLYLNEALDELLAPYGYSWKIEYTSATSRKIVIVQNGVGEKMVVLWQPAGSKLDIAKQNADLVRIDYDASMAITGVLAVGSFTEIEATFELMPAWDKADDNTPLAKLLKNGVVDWDNNPRYHRVWRDWVLNEAGDYPRAWNTLFKPNGCDEQANSFLITEFAGHADVVPRRRKFLPMLTRGPDGQPLGQVGGCDVEWWNPRRAGGLGAGWDKLWTNVPMLECRLLEKECGIKFTGSIPPVMIMRQGNDARVRITATYRSDYRIYFGAGRRNSSTNPDENTAVLDVGRRFHWRGLHRGSKYFSDVSGGRKQADLVDGREALRRFAIAAREAYDQAQCSGSIRLEGCNHWQYDLGNLITKVEGRNLALGVTKPAAEQPVRYPQLLGISYYPQVQSTLLSIAEFKETDAMVGSLLRKTRRITS